MRKSRQCIFLSAVCVLLLSSCVPIIEKAVLSKKERAWICGYRENDTVKFESDSTHAELVVEERYYYRPQSANPFNLEGYNYFINERLSEKFYVKFRIIVTEDTISGSFYLDKGSPILPADLSIDIGGLKYSNQPGSIGVEMHLNDTFISTPTMTAFKVNGKVYPDCLVVNKSKNTVVEQVGCKILEYVWSQKFGLIYFRLKNKMEYCIAN